MNDLKQTLAVVILAAGLGKRMKSSKAKVLHSIHNKPMILYVVDRAVQIAGKNVIVVVGHQAEEVKKCVSAEYDVTYALQEEQLGTGHAVSCALSVVPLAAKDIMILCGDVPMLSHKTLMKLSQEHVNDHCDLTVLGVEAPNPKGYGRLLFDDDNRLNAIVEEADATPVQKQITTINTGIYLVSKRLLLNSIGKIDSKNAQKEFYLTDLIGIAYAENRNAKVAIASDYEEVMGINSLEELKTAESIMLKKIS